MDALGDRPVTLQRFPEGIEGEEFYSKNPPQGRARVGAHGLCTYPSGRRHSQLVVDEAATAVWAMQMNTVTFHPWPVRTEQSTTPTSCASTSTRSRAATFADAVEAALALREVLAEIGLTGWAKTSGNRGVHVYARVAPTHEFLDVRHGVIGIARELERRLPDLVTTAVVEGGAGGARLRRLQPGLPRPHHRLGLQPAPAARARRCRMPVDLGPARGRSAPADFTVLTVPGSCRGPRRRVGRDRRRGGRRRVGALALWDNATSRSAGWASCNFPPDYPKMPGEPPRVQPSKRRTDKPDADYLAPKADRDADVRERGGCRSSRRSPPMLAKSVKGIAASRAGGQLRAEVGRVPLDRLPLRRPRRDRQPQREADDPLLPRGGRGGRWPTCRRSASSTARSSSSRPGERPPRLRPAAAAHPPRRQPGQEARPVETPAHFVAFDLLALGDDDLTGAALRRAAGPAREGPRRRASRPST